MKYIIKNIIVVIITIGLLGFIQPDIGTDAAEEQNSITFDIFTEDYSIIQIDADRAEISIDGFGHHFIIGAPDIPSKIISIAVPPNAIINEVIVTSIESNIIDGTYDIVPCQIPAIISDDEVDVGLQNEYKKNYEQIYESNDPYPYYLGEYVKESHLRRYDLVDVRVNPFTYYPQSKTLEFHQHMRIEIIYEQSDNQHKNIADFSEESERFAEHIIANYHQSEQWYPKEGDSKSLYDYVIITLDSLTSSVQPLVDWEESKGRTVNVVTTSWIESNYIGYDLQEKMRNFLREKYPTSSWGIEYVLLAGHYNDVPLRRCAQDVGYGQPETDFYYAELSLPDSESWDQNGNHQYGESTDSIDFFAEVKVGRIPYSNPSKMEEICEKSVSYEQNDDPSFKKNILFLGAFFWDDTDNAELMEEIAGNAWMSDWSMTRMYEEAQSSYFSDYDLSYSTVESDWSSNSYGFVNWAGHGSPTSCHELYPSSAPAFVDTYTCDSLNDDYPAIIVADACSNQDTDEDNLGRAMMGQGSVGFLGSTKVAMGHPGWDSAYDGSSQSLDYFFTSKVTSGELSTGGAHQWALSEMYSYGLWNYNYYETFEWGAYLGNPDLMMFIPALEISFPDGLPNLIDPDVSTPITVKINEVGDSYVPESGLLHYRFNDGSYQTVTLTHVSGNLYEAIFPPASCGVTPEFYFSANTISSGLITSPSDAPTTVYSCLVGHFIEVLSDDFETDTGWTVSGDTSIGAWGRGIPIGDNRGDPSTDYDGSGQCYITGNADDEDIDDGTTLLTSPSFNLDGEENIYVQYALWYTNDFGSDPNNDVFNTYVSNDDGESWTLVETIGPQSTIGWNLHMFTLDMFIIPSDQVRVRFEASDMNDGSVVEAGIDAFTVNIFECGATEPILSVNPISHNFGVMNVNQTDSTLFEIWNDGFDSLTYSLSESESWLDVYPLTGESTGEHDSITVDVNTTGLDDGSYYGEIQISSNGGSTIFDVYLFVGTGTEILDVSQPIFDRGFRVMPGWDASQEFTPTLSTLSTVKLYMSKFGSPTGNVTVQICDGAAGGTMLSETVLSPDDVPSYPVYDWVTIDIEDVWVTPGETYYIVMKDAQGADTHHCIQWGWCDSYISGSGGPYDGGWFFFRKEFNPTWSPIRDWDFTFRTFGYD